jgi:superfamily II DNA/RNA helicase
MLEPFPIQEAAFPPISKGKNVVIGSATGSGKTLAFMLPILATSKRTAGSQVLVVTPSRELTLQLRREVDLLWPPLQEEESAAGGAAAARSAVHIVDEQQRSADSSLGEDNHLGLMELLSIGNAPILVGTPHSLHRLVTAASEVLRKSRQKSADGAKAFSPEAIARANQLKQNLKTVVIDEADHLLESASVAQYEMARMRLKDQRDGGLLTAKERDALKNRLRSSTTELLMDELSSLVKAKDGSSLENLQFVCASATVGRSLRRQLQGLLNAPSIEKAAELVSAGGRETKKAEMRRAALMPEKLDHKYWLVNTTAPSATDVEDEEEAVGAVGEEDQAMAELEALSLQDLKARAEDLGISDPLGHKGQKKTWIKAIKQRASSSTVGSKPSVHEDILSVLPDAMAAVPPAPAIVFCGRSGVKRVEDTLKAAGMRDVRLLQEAHESEGEGDTAEEQAADWASTRIYVGSERWARGLDLVVDYVFLMGAPTSSAQYAHLAGRTGRKGRAGTAVTLLVDTQAPRLVGIASSLGLGFERLE